MISFILRDVNPPKRPYISIAAPAVPAHILAGDFEVYRRYFSPSLRPFWRGGSIAAPFPEQKCTVFPQRSNIEIRHNASH